MWQPAALDDDLPLVVNLTCPSSPEDYIHRIGRTGRAGNRGEALPLVCADEVNLLGAIENLTRQTFQRGEEAGFRTRPPVPPTAPAGQVLSKPKKSKPAKAGGRGAGERGCRATGWASDAPAAGAGRRGRQRPGKPAKAGPR